MLYEKWSFKNIPYREMLHAEKILYRTLPMVVLVIVGLYCNRQWKNITLERTPYIKCRCIDVLLNMSAEIDASYEIKEKNPTTTKPAGSCIGKTDTWLFSVISLSWPICNMICVLICKIHCSGFVLALTSGGLWEVQVGAGCPAAPVDTGRSV